MKCALKSGWAVQIILHLKSADIHLGIIMSDIDLLYSHTKLYVFM